MIYKISTTFKDERHKENKKKNINFSGEFIPMPMRFNARTQKIQLDSIHNFEIMTIYFRVKSLLTLKFISHYVVCESFSI